MCESRKGVSAVQLKRTRGVACQTGWHLCHRIHEAMGNDQLDGPTLFGIVEVGETFVGGRARGYRAQWTWVAGALQREGRVRLERIPNVRRTTVHGFIARTVRDEAKAIYTDELKSYLGIADGKTRHETVTHSARNANAVTSRGNR